MEAEDVRADWTDDDGLLVRGVLDAISNEHPAADDLVTWSRDELARIEAMDVPVEALNSFEKKPTA